jgi:hypothetical protein
MWIKRLGFPKLVHSQADMACIHNRGVLVHCYECYAAYDKLEKSLAVNSTDIGDGR